MSYAIAFVRTLRESAQGSQRIKNGSDLFFWWVALVGGVWIRNSGVLLSTQATLIHPVLVHVYAGARKPEGIDALSELENVPYQYT
ncbi:MAG: hypothetical protein NXI32_04195 [bacterium]|nr:hypothetical protein [bacterium]